VFASTHSQFFVFGILWAQFLLYKCSAIYEHFRKGISFQVDFILSEKREGEGVVGKEGGRGVGEVFFPS
jgi:hypothetical protein